ncbi:MAG: hypothetical protein IJ720_00575 [Clostridia bacterium]|nr:hypothetical protein [Clostridia bacterium]MBR1703839.1 hypothetical protein [Clostridia bacterium]
MADKKAALLSLVKQIEGTMDAAGLKTEKEVLSSDETRDVIKFSGDAGDVRLEYAGNALEILATNEEDGAFRNIGTLLFEAESDDWGAKDIRSAANEVAETVADFFGTTFVTAGATEKSQKAKGGKNAPAASAAATPAPKKKKKAKKSDTFEPIDLIYRLEAIFPQYAGKADENLEKFGTFLPEEYLAENPGLIEDVLLAIRMEDRTECKKLFKTFNNYYDNGEKDTQSLIAVSILGIGASKEEGLLKVMENYASEDLMNILNSVAAYLSTGAGKRSLKKYADPKPYKESLRERWGRQGLEQAQGQMLDSSALNSGKK